MELAGPETPLQALGQKWDSQGLLCKHSGSLGRIWTLGLNYDFYIIAEIWAVTNLCT